MAVTSLVLPDVLSTASTLAPRLMSWDGKLSASKASSVGRALRSANSSTVHPALFTISRSRPVLCRITLNDGSFLASIAAWRAVLKRLACVKENTLVKSSSKSRSYFWLQSQALTLTPFCNRTRATFAKASRCVEWRGIFAHKCSADSCVAGRTGRVEQDWPSKKRAEKSSSEKHEDQLESCSLPTKQDYVNIRVDKPLKIAFSRRATSFESVKFTSALCLTNVRAMLSNPLRNAMSNAISPRLSSSLTFMES